MPNKNTFDAIIIGGSYAGLSAAMSLGRSLRRVLVIDSGAPCNWQTPHSHNFLTQDGASPAEISTLARQQVEKYDTVKFYKGLATDAQRQEEGFALQTDTGETFAAKKLIFATGIKDQMPDIKGFAECWSISVIHCPYCHGYEYRGQATAMMANGARAMHLASLVSNLTDDLTLLTNGAPDFDAAQNAQLEKARIRTVTTEIAEIEHRDGQVQAVVFADGSRQRFTAVYAAIPFVQHSDIPQKLGCDATETGHIKVDFFQQTSVPGVFACGDNAAPMRSIANAVATGSFAGAMVNKELCEEWV